MGIALLTFLLLFLVTVPRYLNDDVADCGGAPGPDCGYSVSQLSQVQLAVAASPPGPDCDSLVSLQADIEELISLTRENLRSVQKQVDRRGLPTEPADGSHCDEGSLAQTTTSDHFDEEYGLLRVSLRCGTLC
jgi:hypothetical protein